MSKISVIILEESTNMFGDQMLSISVNGVIVDLCNPEGMWQSHEELTQKMINTFS